MLAALCVAVQQCFELNAKRLYVEYHINCVASFRHSFLIPDNQSAGRWDNFESNTVKGRMLSLHPVGSMISNVDCFDWYSCFDWLK